MKVKQNHCLFAHTLAATFWLLPFIVFAQANLLTNPGFETGDASGWGNSYGSYSVVSTNAHTGVYAAKMGQYSAVAQTVTGLFPNTTYTNFGWIRAVTAGQRVYLIAQNFGGTGVNVSTTMTAYTNLAVAFTTGPTNTSVEIAVYASGADGGYCDDLVLNGAGGGGGGDSVGTQASRIADCLQRFGVNTFSTLNWDTPYPWHWGGSHGSYDPTNTASAINYITAGSGLTMNIREYHRDYSGTTAITPLQMRWIKTVYTNTGSPFSIAIAAFGGTNDVPGIASLVQDSVTSGLNYVKWVEGINEPNNFGPVPIATTVAAQSMLCQQVHAITTNVTVMGPSIVFGLPYPDGWLTGYPGTNLQTILNDSDANNLHVYPPKSPNASDGSNRGGTLADVDIAFSTNLPGKPAINTEWHPTLFSSIHKTNELYDAYWGPIYLMSSYYDFNWQANFWFALFDYNSATMPCGLFATGPSDPKPVADAFRALFQLTGDTGSNKLTFTPGKLDVTVSGLPAAPSGSPYAGGRTALFENSSGEYFLMIWDEENDLSTNTTSVTVTFNSHDMAEVEEFNVTSGSETPVQSLNNVHSMTVNLDTSMRLLRITY